MNFKKIVTSVAACACAIALALGTGTTAMAVDRSGMWRGGVGRFNHSNTWGTYSVSASASHIDMATSGYVAHYSCEAVQEGRRDTTTVGPISICKANKYGNSSYGRDWAAYRW